MHNVQIASSVWEDCTVAASASAALFVCVSDTACQTSVYGLWIKAKRDTVHWCLLACRKYTMSLTVSHHERRTISKQSTPTRMFGNSLSCRQIAVHIDYLPMLLHIITRSWRCMVRAIMRCATCEGPMAAENVTMLL